MSRSGYSYDLSGFELGRWRRAVDLAITGKRGQKMLKEMLEALDAMPVKELAAKSLVTEEGKVCALGALGTKRKLDMDALDAEDREQVGKAFGIAGALAAEVVFMNDEWEGSEETPAERWTRMRAWVAENIFKP